VRVCWGKLTVAVEENGCSWGTSSRCCSKASSSSSSSSSSRIGSSKKSNCSRSSNSRKGSSSCSSSSSSSSSTCVYLMVCRSRHCIPYRPGQVVIRGSEGVTAKVVLA